MDWKPKASDQKISKKSAVRPGHKPTLRIQGTYVGAGKHRGKVTVLVNGQPIGTLPPRKSLMHCAESSDVYPVISKSFKVPAGARSLSHLPKIELARGNDGTWFVPRRADLFIVQNDSTHQHIARWTPKMRDSVSVNHKSIYGTKTLNLKLQRIFSKGKPDDRK